MDAVFALVVRVLAALSAALCFVQPVQAAQVFSVKGTASQSLDSVVMVLQDPSGTLDLAAVRALPEGQWQQPVLLPFNPGFSNAAWWLRVQLRNDAPGPALQRVIDIESPVQDRIDAYVVYPAGGVEALPPMGDRVPFANRLVRNVHPVVPLHLEPQESVAVYLRLSSHDGLHEQVPLSLLTPEALDEASHLHWLWSGLYYGIFICMLAYAVCLYAVTRYPSLAFYAGYVASALAWRLVFTGDGFYLLWPDAPVFNNQILPLTVGAWFFCSSLLTAHFLDLKAHMPRVHRVMSVSATISAVGSLPALANWYAVPFAVVMPFGMVWALCAMVCEVRLARHGWRVAKWMVVSWLPLVVCAMIYAVQLLALPGWNLLDSPGTALQLSAAGQSLLLGLVVGETTNRWRRDKLLAERQARMAQEELAAGLEVQVQERTRELAQLNQQLLEMSIIDALTGVHNRRHFNEVLDVECKRAQREGSQFTLCLVDVDHFKAFNDHYGHPAGDGALRAIADTLKARLRRAGDHVFRVGGEEFALILAPTDFDAALKHVEFLRQAVEALGLPHVGNPGGVVTASFGMLQPHFSAPGGFSASALAPTLYREADRLLYAAKATGRNRVVSESFQVEVAGPLPPPQAMPQLMLDDGRSNA